MNYIITKNKKFFEDIGEYNYCDLHEMKLGKRLAIDTETTGLFARKNKLFCIQIGTGENNYIIDLQSYAIGNNDGYCPKDVFPYLKDKTLVFHNAVFDLGFFYKENFFPDDVRDTLLGSRILYNGDVENIRHDFGTVMMRELKVYYDKTDQKNIHIVRLSQPSTIKYSFNDVDKLLELEETLEKKLIEDGYEETYKLHCRYIKALAYIEQCGFAISPEAWKDKMMVDIENTKRNKLQIEEFIFDNCRKFRDVQIDMFNTLKRINISVTSPRQMLKVFEEFGINTKDKEGKDSINADIISKSTHPFVKMWLDFQESLHRVSTFGETIYKQIEDNRIYTSFNPMVDTARLSTRKGGINFLNFPNDKETRDCFIANKGNDMIVCDWAGQETVIAADFSGDKAMTDSVINNSDLHCAFARILFPEIEDLSDEEIMKQHKAKRQASKSPRFAFSYGGNAYTIHVNEGTPLERAREIEIGFKKLHEGLYKWGEQVYQESIKKGYIESVNGWKLKLPRFRDFTELKAKVGHFNQEQWTLYKQGKEEFLLKKEDPKYAIKYPKSVEFYELKRRDISNFFKLKSEYQRLCLNSPVQTCGAHQLKLATSMFFEWIIENNLVWKVKIDNTVHDEIIVESEHQYSERAKQALEKCMLDGGNKYLTNLKIKADANIGISWGKAK